MVVQRCMLDKQVCSFEMKSTTAHGFQQLGLGVNHLVMYATADITKINRSLTAWHAPMSIQDAPVAGAVVS